mmetsp:Transcript_7278/g.14834  ORF Transcript_7278/g.14834 Transcript_7278/m.14834 type:complete len:237 (+) Transcript_7278:1116-1826(+)
MRPFPSPSHQRTSASTSSSLNPSRVCSALSVARNSSVSIAPSLLVSKNRNPFTKLPWRLIIQSLSLISPVRAWFTSAGLKAHFAGGADSTSAGKLASMPTLKETSSNGSNSSERKHRGLKAAWKSSNLIFPSFREFTSSSILSTTASSKPKCMSLMMVFASATSTYPKRFASHASHCFFMLIVFFSILFWTRRMSFFILPGGGILSFASNVVPLFPCTVCGLDGKSASGLFCVREP